MTRSARSRTAPVALGLLAGVALSGCSAAEAPERREESRSPAPTTASADYADGTYEARGWYGGLPSHQDYTLTVEDGAVTAVEVTTPAEDETSLGYQQRFADALPGEIVGRPLADLRVTRVAGSSGCSEGFMDALEKIRRDAAA